ncbi:MAG: tyrosine-type recombinase/integrase [Chloroflexi bacterium]|nr:tyrosine-type recombinase/integrase [Chloroflexota bacterium]
MTLADATQHADLSQRQARLHRENSAVLMPSAPSKDQKSRLGFFIDWLTRAERHWYQPDLRAYRDYLLYERTRRNNRNQVKAATLSPQTALAHLATIRGRYKELTRSNEIRDRLYELANPYASEAEQRALVDEFFVRLANDLHPTAAPIKVVEMQDRADSEHLRLKPYQVNALLGAPGISSLRGLRDTALMTLMVCTGIRAAEAAALHVDDLRQQLGGELSLRVREGKGGKQRLIPYGPLNWCLMYMEAWLQAAQIKAGPVFRRILKGNRSIGAKGIGAWTVNDIMNNYPISMDGALRLVKPHDLRRTYARNAYDFGMDLERIRQNLGHASLQTTQTYIGALDGRDRHPPNMFRPPHDQHSLALLTGSAIG